MHRQHRKAHAKLSTVTEKAAREYKHGYRHTPAVLSQKGFRLGAATHQHEWPGFGELRNQQNTGACQVDAVLALTSREASRRLALLLITPLIVLYILQVLVRVRPPIGHEANEELAVACSPTQEHVQAGNSVNSFTLIVLPNCPPYQLQQLLEDHCFITLTDITRARLMGEIAGACA